MFRIPTRVTHWHDPLENIRLIQQQPCLGTNCWGSKAGSRQPRRTHLQAQAANGFTTWEVPHPTTITAEMWAHQGETLSQNNPKAKRQRRYKTTRYRAHFHIGLNSSAEGRCQLAWTSSRDERSATRGKLCGRLGVHTCFVWIL